MQACLNNQDRYIISNLKKYPSLLVAMVAIAMIGIGLLTLSILCNTSFSCTYQERDIMLFVGLNMCIWMLVLYIIPTCLRILLNSIYKEKKSSSRRNYPLSYVPPPRGTPPRSAMRSFRQSFT
jgi:hypothetical protein